MPSNPGPCKARASSFLSPQSAAQLRGSDPAAVLAVKRRWISPSGSLTTFSIVFKILRANEIEVRAGTTAPSAPCAPGSYRAGRPARPDQPTNETDKKSAQIIIVVIPLHILYILATYILVASLCLWKGHSFVNNNLLKSTRKMAASTTNWEGMW